MKITNLMVNDITVTNLLNHTKSNLVSYRIDKENEKMQLEFGNGRIKEIAYKPRNLELCENKMYHDFMREKERIEQFLRREKEKTKWMGLALFGTSFMLPFPFGIVLVGAKASWVNKRNFRLCQMEDELNKITFVATKQEPIEDLLTETPFLQTLSLSSRETIKKNERRYTLNNYDEIPLVDRNKIQKKVLEIQGRPRRIRI